MSKEGVAKNSSITITFDKAITQINLDKIKIECGGIDYKEYFNQGQIREDKKQITYTAKRNNLIPNFIDTKVIEVTIPKTFTYNAGTEKDKIEVPFYEDQVFTYRIKDQTLNRLTVYKQDPTYTKGELVQDGIGVLNFDDKVTFYFNPNKAYYVDGWSFKDASGADIDLSPTCVLQEITNNKTVLTLTFKEPLSGMDTIYVTPDVKDKKKFLVNTSGAHATLVPNEQKTYYKDDTFTIDCREENDWFFVSWKVYKAGIEVQGTEKTDQTTGKTYYEYSDILTVDNPYIQNATVTVLKEDEEITFTPELVVRPKIVSATPIYDSNGVYKDRRISVMFDKKLDASCIYFEEDEFKALGGGYTAIRCGGNPNGKIYAYYKTGYKNSIVYKAFKITKLNNESINLLEYYGEPSFDDGNTGVLKLGPNKTENITPPGSTDILVTVNKDIGYLVTRSDGKEMLVSLSGEYKWAYYTNQNSDNEAPAINHESSIAGEDKLEVYIIDQIEENAEDENDVNYTDVKQINHRLIQHTAFTSPNDFALYNNEKAKLWVKAEISDGGSGPEYLIAKVYRYTKEFTNIYPVGETIKTGVPVITRKVKLSSSGSNGYTYTDKIETQGETQVVTQDINGCLIDLMDENTLNALPEEGVYYVIFTAEDKNNNESLPLEENTYFFVWDTNKPSLPTLIKETRKEANSTNIGCKIPSDLDWKEIKVIATDITEDSKIDDNNPRDTEKSVSYTDKTTSLATIQVNGLTDQHKYEYTIQTWDYAGHYVETKATVDNTPPKPSNGSEKRTSATETSLNWKNPSDMDFSYLTITRNDITEGDNQTPSETKLHQKDETIAGSTKNSISTAISGYKVTGLQNQHKYKYTITAYDWSGNYESIEIQDDVKPKITNFVEQRTSATETILNWTNPNNSDFSKLTITTEDITESGSEPITITHQKDEAIAGSTKNSINTAISGYIVTGLQNQHKYKHTITAYDWSGNHESVVIQDDVKPKITNGVEHRKKISETELNWTNPNNSDFCMLTITTTDITEDSRLAVGDTKTPEITKIFQRGDILVEESGSNPKITNYDGRVIKNYVVSGLANKHKYSHTITAYDWSGNSESVVIQDDVAPAKRTFVGEERNDPDRTYLYWSDSDSVYYDDHKEDLAYCVIERYLASDTSFENCLSITDSSLYGSTIIYDLTDGERYTYKVYSCDYSGNRSEPFIWTKTKKPSIAQGINTVKWNYKDGKVILSFYATYGNYGYPSITYKKTYNDTEAPRTFNCGKVNLTTWHDFEIPLYRNGHQYSFFVTMTDYHGIVGDPVEVRTDTYIIENKNQDNGSIGAFVLKGTRVDQTEMADVLTTETEFETYSANTLPKSLPSLKSNEVRSHFLTDPGAFTNARTGNVNTKIKLKPYQIGKYEFVDKMYTWLYNNSIDSGNNFPKVYGGFFEPCQACNKMSIAFGYKPCYSLYSETDGTCKTEIPVDTWAAWSWNDVSSDTFKKFDNNLICDFNNNGFRLPTELEWECAARNGSQTRYDSTYDVYPWYLLYSTTANRLREYDNVAERAGTLATKNDLAGHGKRENGYKGYVNDIYRTPNYLDIHLMSGNAWEWCWDANNGGKYSNDSIYGYAQTSLQKQNVENGKSGPFPKNYNRTVRGGCWGDGPGSLYVCFRHAISGTSNLENVGYRLARTLGIPEQEQYSNE